MYCCCPLVRSVAPIDQEDFATSRCRKKRSSRYRITFVRRTFQKRKTHYRRQHHHREHCHHHLRFDKIRKTCQNNITSICPSLQRLRQCVRAGLLIFGATQRLRATGDLWMRVEQATNRGNLQSVSCFCPQIQHKCLEKARKRGRSVTSLCLFSFPLPCFKQHSMRVNTAAVAAAASSQTRQ